MFKEFKEFALKGNLIEIAVGLVLALAFTTVVTAFINGIVMPLIAAIVGKPTFDSITVGVGDATLLVGTFITALVNFLIVALVLFLIVKAANRLMQKEEAETGPTEVELLAEIRDSLRSRGV